MALSDADKEKMRNSLRNAGQSITSEDPQELFELMLIQRLKEQDVEINNRQQLKIDYPQNIEAAIMLIEGQGDAAQREAAVKMFASRSSRPIKPYRATIRTQLRQLNVAIRSAPDDPEPVLEFHLVKALRGLDVDIAHRMQLKINYPKDISGAMLLIEAKEPLEKRQKAAKIFASQSNLRFKPYRAELRDTLLRKNITPPVAPENPEPLFETHLVNALRERDVDINDRDQLKITYPQDIKKAALLIEGGGTPAEQEDAIKIFASQSSRPFKPYRAELRKILLRKNIIAPAAPENPEPLFETHLVKLLRERDVDIDDRNQLKIYYPDSIKEAAFLFDGIGTPGQQEDRIRMFARFSGRPFNPHRAEIRKCLAKKNIIAPPSPENPEPLFEKHLVWALRDHGVDINDRDQLKTHYPNDARCGILLIERNDDARVLASIVESFARNSGRAIKPKTTQAIAPAAPKPVPTAAPIAPKVVTPVVIPRSNAPSPIKLDRTVTVAKLLQTNSSGKSNLETLGEQGQLAEVFTDKIWIDRREEMDQAWEQVPERFRNQVSIEVVRGQLSQATVRDKFGIGEDKEWGKGF